ncbi:winged helix-turn-helix transcriptional regulator [Streptomyces iranensis]|uniref:DNA-binding HxlR family transcriptional regulator n=1 Tax=Streptomyces iranensis TaxID=576784 RepID=A0A061A0B5_9ACTN|nr:helix-turn-helix domain-containing protein [Streptomyces iranensis]MBP2065471.1 DNA-binding HxlR family transcriptional regulator [Streptomyces iranensis]CDR08814.1 MarR family transcriptional regulator [Streptomyces iranensis]
MRGNPGEIQDQCAVEIAMEVLGGRWKLAIIRKLFIGTHRFGELRRALPGVTQRMLTRQLRELEADGLISRTVHAEVPPRVEYALTDTGRSLERITDLLDSWGRWYRDTRPHRDENPVGRA